MNRLLDKPGWSGTVVIENILYGILGDRDAASSTGAEI